MDREWKQVLIVVGIVAILVLGGWAGIKVYSGMDNSMTVVVSGSMQHSDKSTIGIIDTGDMIVMKNKDKGIQTYVEGYNNGHSTFGEYGDVIIYNRPNENPVIHRAIVWLDYNNNGTFSAKTLQEKDKGKLWTTNTGTNEGFITLTLTLPNGGNNDDMKEFVFNATALKTLSSGYITKGDSVNNYSFDCMCSINNNSLVTMDKVKGVAGLEIPWLGAIKLYVNGDTKYIQSNTPYCLVFLILDIIALLVLISLIWDCIDRKYCKQ